MKSLKLLCGLFLFALLGACGHLREVNHYQDQILDERRSVSDKSPFFAAAVDVSQVYLDQNRTTIFRSKFEVCDQQSRPYWVNDWKFGTGFGQTEQDAVDMALERCRKKSPPGRACIVHTVNSNFVCNASHQQFLDRLLSESSAELGVVAVDVCAKSGFAPGSAMRQECQLEARKTELQLRRLSSVANGQSPREQQYALLRKFEEFLNVDHSSGARKAERALLCHFDGYSLDCN